jgi:osmotically-inducible protein OsmY
MDATSALRKESKGVDVISNDDLTDDVNEELKWDPKVNNETIAVSADNGVVTLRGSVASLREKHEAKKAAARVYGVTSVDEKLQVRLPGLDGREDAELRGDVLQALMLDSIVPSTVDASVEDGYIRLSGTAEWKYQRDEAEFVAGNIRGVVGVWDDVELTGPPPVSDDVEHSIEKAFKRNAKLDAKELKVETDDRTVTLSGTVRSWAEKDDAVAAAWAALGVQQVKDHIVVSY